MHRPQRLHAPATVFIFPQKRTVLVALFLSVLASLPGIGFEAVVIDPGHGGTDEGTAWYHVTEKDTTLGVALRLEKLLQKNNIPCFLTRRTDVFMSLDDRVKVADQHPRSLLISIHFNGNYVESSSGFATYYFAASPAGKFTAETIQQALDEFHDNRNRGIHTQDYAVLVRTTGCAVLVECGFLSNKAESRLFSSPEGQEKLAESLLLGILRAKVVSMEDPPETEMAKCEAYAKRLEEKERKHKASVAPARPPTEPPKPVAKKK